MGIILGYLALILFCILSAKAVTHRCQLKKADRFLMKLHKPVSVLLVGVCFLHIILVIPVLRNRSIWVIVTGAAGMFIMFLLICFCHVIKDSRKKNKWHRIFTIVMAVCIVSHMVTYFADFKDYQQKIEEIILEDIDFANLQEGVYEGAYDAGYIYAKVEVVIQDGAIIEINLLEHRNERGKSAEVILDDIVFHQKLDVDAISGATNSSKVIKKAIENAIRQAKQ